MSAPFALVLWLASNLVADHPNHSGDTIQFQFLSEVYGVPHPPGAPVYTAMVWAWRHLQPWSTPAFAANSFSVLAALVASGFAMRLLRRWAVPLWMTVLSLLALLGTPVWMRLSTVAELYLPALAVGIAALERTQAWSESGRRRDLLAVGVLLGLGSGIHPTVLLYGPACLFLVLQRERQPWREPVAWAALIGSGLGVVVAITIVLLAALSPATRFVWAPITDFASASDFLSAEAFRSEIEPFAWSGLVRAPWEEYVDRVFGGATWLVGFGVVGLVVSLRSWRGAAVLWLLLANAVYVLSYPVWDMWDFVLPGQLAFALWVALGLAWMGEKFRRSDLAWRSFVLLAVVLAAAQLNSVPERAHDAVRTLHDRFWVERAVSRLELVGPGGVLASPGWEDSCALWYQLFVHPERFGAVQLVSSANAADIDAYLEVQRTLPQVTQRRAVALGREVFVLGDRLARALVDSGRTLYALRDDVYFVATSLDSSLGGRWPGVQPVELRPDATRTDFLEGFGPAEDWGRWMFETSATVEIRNLRARAVLDLALARWSDAQPALRVEMWFEGSRLGTFTVDAAEWEPQRFRVELGNDTELPLARLELRVDTLHTAPGDRPRGAAVVEFMVR